MGREGVAIEGFLVAATYKYSFSHVLHQFWGKESSRAIFFTLIDIFDPY
jgi:hypothetical protein